MEIQGENGSKTLLEEGANIDFGRGLGFDSDDLTVSRRHISFHLAKSNHKKSTKIGFVVTGKNPTWVYSSGNGEIRIFRRSERGEMESGDLFCVSAKNPVWFKLKRIEFEGTKVEFEDGLAESLQSSHGLPEDVDLELEAGDNLSNVDPIKEFGFLVLGHEFDDYPKKMMRHSKNWDWFLEEDGGKSDSDEDGNRKRKKGMTRKRKKGGGSNEDDDDDDWTGESEEDAELITKSRKVQTPKYSTRSKDHGKGTSIGERSRQKDATETKEIDEDDEEEDEDDADETLGGFIVDDEGAEEEEKENDEDEEEEEEEFDEDEDEE